MVHIWLIKIGLTVDTVVGSSCVYMYAKCNLFEYAIQLEIPDKDVACWNTVYFLLLLKQEFLMKL